MTPAQTIAKAAARMRNREHEVTPEFLSAVAAFLESWTTWDIGHREGEMPTALDFQNAHAIAVAYLGGER